MTGKPDACLPLSSDIAKRFGSRRGHQRLRSHAGRKLYFTNRVLTGHPGSLRSRHWTSLTVADRPVQLRRQVFFTNRTLTGNKRLFALGIRSRHRRELSLAAPAPIIFHQSHFDWKQRLSFSITESAYRCQFSIAAPSPNIFHQSHFDWTRNSLPLDRHDGWTYS